MKLLTLRPDDHLIVWTAASVKARVWWIFPQFCDQRCRAQRGSRTQTCRAEWRLLLIRQ